MSESDEVASVSYACQLKAGSAQHWSTLAKQPSSPIFPSAELQQVLAAYAAFSRGPAALPASALWSEAALPATRKFYENASQDQTGVLLVPTVPAEALKAARGIDAYWVAWPGVDVSAAAPTLLFLHGGGLCAGSAHSSAGFLDRISRIFAMRVLALDYPLCPEATPSEAVASALAAYSHLIDDLKVPPKKVLLVGVSGGGTLALLTAEAIAGRGLPAPAAAWLISVWAGSRDAAILARHARACETDALFANGNTIAFMLEHLYRLGKPDELPVDDPRACPLRGSTAGLPPTFLSWDADESLAIDSELALAKLRAGGVAAGSSTTRFGLHVLPLYQCPEAAYEMAIAHMWLRQYLA